MVNFWAPDTIPDRFAGRRFYRHNPDITLMRTTPDENAELGRVIAERINREVDKMLKEPEVINRIRGFGFSSSDAMTSKSLAEAIVTSRITTPQDFNQLFPATGGAIYGRATHGWRATFTRPGVRSTIPNLYLAGGSVNPGAGIPMAALSGLTAAACLMQDRTSP